MRARKYGLAGLGFGALLFVGQVLGASTSHQLASESTSLNAIGQIESGYTLDDGAELQSQAVISIDEAVAAAQTAATGEIGEIDLETVNGVLVYNVDVGDADVKVDATTGDVVSTDYDD